MAKRALLVGINRYQVAGADLRGCVNDVKDMSAALVEFHGFKTSDITVLADDPIRHGVPIPRSFWKVMTFVHDETGELCATGYTMSQEDFLREEEFVFGQHKTSRARIATIEQRAGLSFGPLAALDPFDGDQEGVAALLTDPAQIRFFRRR